MMPKAKEAALKAISIEDLAEAHTTLCSVYSTCDYDFAGAERECRRAIELNPGYSTAHHYYGLLLTRLGRHQESFAEFQKALELEPLSLIINRNYAESFLYSRRYNESEAQYRKTIELDPTFSTGHLGLSNLHTLMGKYAESVDESARSKELIGEAQNASLVREAFSRDGWTGFLRLLTEDANRLNISAHSRAWYLALLGRKDQAFENLNIAHQNREYRVGHILVDPRLDPLRDDPRFQELVRKMGLQH